MDDKELRERICGALVGVAVGDAMGMPVEMWPRGRIRQRFGSVDSFLPAPEDNEITHGLRAYEVTDDTRITVLVAESLIEEGGAVRPESIIRKIKAWSESDSKSANVLGPSTKRAFAEIARGVPLGEAGRYGETNGASMRIIPVGAVSDLHDLAGLVENVRLASVPTHNTGVAIAAASAIAAAVAYGLEAERADPEGAVHAAQGAATLGATRGYEVFAPSVARRIDLAASIAGRFRHDPPRAAEELSDLVGSGLPSHESIPSALGLVLASGGDPLLCARLAANMGGDTDTIGAMACGVCGAMTGLGGFPAETVSRLESVNGIDFRALAAGLAEARKRRRP